MPKKRKSTDKDGLYSRADSAYWWASYVDASGKRVRRSTRIAAKAANRREAEALLAKWKLEAHLSRQWDQQPNHSYDELMLDYVADTSAKRRPSSQEAVLMHIEQLRTTFAGQEMETLCANDIRAHIKRRRAEGVSDSSINRELEVLSAAIHHAQSEWEWVLPNPVKDRMLPEPEGRLRWLARAEAAALLASARANKRAPHLAPLIMLALHCGMRRGEMLGLEWSRVDRSAGLIYLEAEHTKAKKRRAVPINPLAEQALSELARFRAEHCPDTRWVICNKRGEPFASVQSSFETACRNAKIQDFRFHDLRHTCAAWLVQLGVPLAEVRDVLGHASVVMTERYAHLAPEGTRSALNKLAESESRFGHVVDLTDRRKSA